MYINRGSCPSIHARPAATKGLAWQPKQQRKPHQRGSSKNRCGEEGSKAESPPPVFRGEEHPLRNLNLSTIQPAYVKK
eukprot:8616334-Ditylum_brightwellii.AAC.1